MTSQSNRARVTKMTGEGTTAQVRNVFDVEPHAENGDTATIVAEAPSFPPLPPVKPVGLVEPKEFQVPGMGTWTVTPGEVDDAAKVVYEDDQRLALAVALVRAGAERGEDWTIQARYMVSADYTSDEPDGVWACDPQGRAWDINGWQTTEGLLLEDSAYRYDENTDEPYEVYFQFDEWSHSDVERCLDRLEEHYATSTQDYAMAAAMAPAVQQLDEY